VVTVLGDYRLAPTFKWPTGAQDVGAVVAWTRANIAAHGGDPAKIVLFRSLGRGNARCRLRARKALPAGDGLGLGRRDPRLGDLRSLDRSDRRRQPAQPYDVAYYGADTSQYASQATGRHADAPKLRP